MKLRKMCLGDIDKIVSYENLYLGSSLGRDQFLIELNSKEACFLVIEDNEEIKGYISSTIDEYSEILNFFVVESERGKGLGYKLLNEVIQNAKEKNSKSIYLEVSAKNQNAIALYEKCGFIVDHIRKNYYKDADAYAMIKEL